MSQSVETIQYFDPFGENGMEEFNPLDTYQQIVYLYKEDAIVHDDAADEFVRRTEALMLDATFLGLMEQANQIAIMAHQMCEHNPSLQQSLDNSRLLSEKREDDPSHDHSSSDGHGHKDSKEEERKKSRSRSKTTSLGDWLISLSQKKSKPQAKK